MYQENRVLAEFPQMSQQEVLEKLQSEREYWEGLLAQLDEPSMLLPGVGGTEWTVKDIIAHVGAYERWMATMLGVGIEPLPPFPPDVNDYDADSRNAWFYQHFRDTPLAELQDSAREAYEGLVAGIRQLDDEQMNTLVVFGTRDGQEVFVPAEEGHTYPYPLMPLWKWIADESYEHYQQHYADMEAWIAETQATTD